MAAVTLSKRFGFVIPKAIRESLCRVPGQKIQVFIHENRIVLIPVRPISEMRGLLRGIDTSVERDEDRVNVDEPTPAIRMEVERKLDDVARRHGFLPALHRYRNSRSGAT